MIYIIFIIGLIGTKIIIPYFKSLLIESNITKKNYLGKEIPVSMGIVFLPFLVINSIILRYYIENNIIYSYLFGAIAMGFVGIIDDLIGTRDVTGLKGHIKSLIKGKLTTGGFKALFGGFVALCISVGISKNIQDIIINTMMIALFTNLLNLLDLRPGRSIKGYLFISVLFFLSVNSYEKILIALLTANVIAYFKEDIKALSMMGDAGSNILGVWLGIISANSFNIYTRIAILIGLILIHIITEKYSLTKIIENNKFLNYIDKLGR
ncbi:UDP-N-acetylmuramyl pentapeptide phosphotransferase/UDP-N-acetylglucosamine-1-phosphate transferase [Alkalithermobacter thermoalcaliphilus JW-YL-7 = DSM 7308]|uniref:Glycosyl transferase family 4 n=1 Tax=Alkalithermobacter thermoalcaliphilus JW-YL-7 = DSM 7308 TaxID=1121328 RepID=A0A150FQ11_CLOPD|nr:glycosyl transferase family 4 [[Clostridium] paradoxum JW-YL-7 = DSM 7308]SHK65726.1 UDP-N-acetylmuramyl pentapeptide phosphotransferase/UDP-N-acetylglucosamine-1-phosphate transferase [[Clostridium] paradoxum JW-YL-7 = DSM 7308]